MRSLLAILLCVSASAAELEGVGVWFQRPVSYCCAVDGKSTVRERKALQQATEYALAQWQDMAAIRFDKAGYPTLRIVLDNTGRLPREYAGQTFIAQAWGVILWTDIVINGVYRWDRAYMRASLRALLVHEVGHTLGLGHSDDSESVMYWLLNPWSVITGEDAAVVVAKYGSNQ